MNQDSESIAQANVAWGNIVAETLFESGVTQVFFSPGSRSTPLVLGFEKHPKINCTPILDERSAAFIALGFSKRTSIPCAVLCTSGSAPTHWFPAITEASHSGVPVLFLSADRPPELQDCGAGQTINQINLFGNFVRLFKQIEIPEISEQKFLSLHSDLIKAIRLSTGKNPGPVHLNFPFREPFIPENYPEFKKNRNTLQDSPNTDLSDYESIISTIQNEIKNSKYPIIIAGQFAPAEALIPWLEKESIPVICDSLSSLRETNFENRILRYEHLLRDSEFSVNACPDLILTLGPLPTSKTLRRWISQTKASRIVIEPRGCKVDPLPSPSMEFDLPFSQLSQIKLPNVNKDWGNHWFVHEKNIEKKLTRFFDSKSFLFEAKISRILSQHIAENSIIHIANSMPIRDVEWFWQASEKVRILEGNRGVNGIDGTLGTALGLAHLANNPCFLITGELAFLHDSNALLFSDFFQGSLTVFIINNQGGGIFEYLPVSKEPEFEKCFATPQNCNFQSLCAAHDIKYKELKSWDQLIEIVKNPISRGIQVIEIKTDRKTDRAIREEILQIKATN